MTNKEIIDLYGLTKLGVHNTVTKKCLCGQEMDINEKKCPNCQTALPKSKLMNINKNTALSKRFAITDDGKNASLTYYHMMSKGFELYETKALVFSLNRETLDVRISSTHIFKSLKENEHIELFLNTFEPGFATFIKNCLKEQSHGYAVTNITSLNESQIKSFLNVFLHYRALIPYLFGYKILYFGEKLDLKKYFPETDFCSKESVAELGIVCKLLHTWDMKNERYIETMIELEEMATENQKKVLITILEQMFELTRRNTGWRNRVSYDDIINAFSILYNKEISLEDFIRIYQNSRENFFFQIYEYRNAYKKLNKSRIDWSQIEKIDRKEIGSILAQKSMKEDLKMKTDEISTFYKKLEKAPWDVLKSLAG